MAKVIKAAIIAVVVVVATIVLINTLGAAGAFGAASKFTAINIGMAAATTFIGSVVAGGIGMLTNKGISASAGNFGTKVSGLGGAVARQLIYGTARVGGIFVKMDTRGTKNAILSTSVVVAGHPCDGFDEMYFGETKLTFTSATLNGETVHSVTNTKFRNSENENAFGTDTLARFTFHNGTQTAVDGLAAAGNSSRYPSTTKFLGCSYFYLELVYDPEKMPNIPKIWFVMRGKNIYDPRTSAISTTDAQRQNPALQIRDYLTDTTYGLKALSSEINDSNGGGGFVSAANLCDDLVTLTVDGNNDPLTTERRYTSSGISNFSASGSGLIEAITTACAGNVTYTNGRFNLFGGAGQTAALTITDDNLLAPPRITTQSQSGELFNAVKSIYINKDDNYQASEIGQFSSNAFLAADTPSGEASANFKRVLELRYPFTTSQTTAQRLQRISLDHQRQATTVDLVTSLEFMKAQPNDWIYLTNTRLGYTNKTFEIQNMSMTFLENDGQIFAATLLSLQEIDASVFNFAFSSYSTPQANASQSVIGELDISPPTIGTPIQVTNVEGQTAKINIKVVWTNAVDSAIQGTEIQFKKNGEADSLYVTATLAGRSRTTAEIANVTVGVTYNIRVRHFSFDNVSSVYSSVANIAIAQPDTITNPSNLAVTTDKPFNIELSWTNPSNTNMRAVDVHKGTTTSYTPSPSNLVGTYYGDIGKKKTVLIGKSHGLDYGTDFYFKIRAVNIYGSVVEDGSGNPVYVTSPAGKMVRATTADVENLNASVITAGTIDANQITVNNLNASKMTTGQLTLTASATSAVKAGKSSYEDATTAGFFLGFTNPDVGSRVEGIFIGTSTNGMRYDTANGLVVSGNISATTGSIGGFTISTTSIRDAADSFGLSSAVTGGDDIRFYAGATLANKANAPFRVTEAGVLTATSGTFSGALSSASGTFTGALSGGTISIGSSNNIFKADSNGIYLGNATFGSAPFRVTPAGALTSTSGAVGGFTLGSTSLIAGANATRVSLSTADGIHLGNNTFSSAPFRVTRAGAVTATSGAIGGFTLSGASLIAGSGNTRVSLSTADGISLGNNTFDNAPFSVTRAGALKATSATITGAITATSGSLSSLAVSGALTVGTSGKITGGTSTSFNTGAGFFLGYDSDAYKFSIGDASTKKNLTWDGTDIKIGGAQITAPDNPAVVIYDARSSSPPSVTNARVVLTSNTNTFYLKQDYSEALRVEVVYPLGLLTSGTVSGEQTAIDSTMASIQAAVSYAPVSDPTNFTLFGNINSTRKTTASSLIGSYLVKTTNLGGGNFKAELQTKTQVRTANPTLSGISLGTVDDEYNLVKSFTKYDFPSGDYVFKVVITITDGTASSYPSSGSPSADLIRSVNIYGFKNIERDSFAYAVEPYYQPLTTFRADNSNEVARLSDGADTLELAAINAQGVPRLVMIGPNTTNPSSGVSWGASINFVTSFASYTNGGNGEFQIGIDKSGTGLYLGVGGNTPHTSSELKITNGRVDVIGSLFVSSNLDVDGSIEFDSLSGTGSVAVTDILDQDDMSSNSATALATQQSIKAYVDAQVDTADSLSEILAIGNTSGSNNIEMGTNQKVQFRDSAIYINSSADGQLDIVADTEIQIAATTIDVNGILDVSGRIVGSTFGTGDTGIQNNTSLNGVQAFRPDISSGSADNYLSMGTYSVRWTQIFAVNGTIQTSDNNEKQDVEELNDAEKRVAVSAKSLIKKFRWKSAVAEKGDSARIHFGVVAQDLKSAFETEGLDASRYGLFCSDTWTEDGVEKTRLGVRYNELLAFIISAI